MINNTNHSDNSKIRQKVKFSTEEDQRLIFLVNKYGPNSWNIISAHMNGRNVRQCRERWRHYLSPQVSTKPWTYYEDCILMQKYAEFGPKWKNIAVVLPHRTEISVKNRFLLKKRHDQRLSSQIVEISNEYVKKIFDKQKVPQVPTPKLIDANYTGQNYRYLKRTGVITNPTMELNQNPHMHVIDDEQIAPSETNENSKVLQDLFNSQDVSLFDLDEDYFGLNQDNLWVNDFI